MDAQGALYIAKGLCIFAMVGTAIGQGILISGGLQAIGRNPEIEGSLFTKKIVMVAMTETTAIFAFVAFFLLK